MLKYSFGALVVVMMIFEVGTVNGSKSRTWIGPETFYEGELPSPRQGHAMLSTDDGVLYLFGGWGNSGKRLKYTNIHRNMYVNLAQLPETKLNKYSMLFFPK